MWCVMPTTAANNSAAVTTEFICVNVVMSKERRRLLFQHDSFLLCLATVTDRLQSWSGDVG